jgi:hypothetical protein
MPNDSYSDALKEVATLAPNGEVMLDAIRISHSVAGQIYLVNDRADLDARDENNVPQSFISSNFLVGLPESSDQGTQHLNITVPNVDRAAGDFLEQVPLDSAEPVEITYFTYLSGQADTQQPQNDPPIVLHLTDIELDVFQVSGRASFQSIINKKYPSELYTLDRFPALGS